MHVAELLLALVLVLQFQELVLLQVAFLVELVVLQRDLRPVLLQDVHTKICREEKKMKFINANSIAFFCTIYFKSGYTFCDFIFTSHSIY